LNQLVDLSHSIEHGMITYKGLPAPIICDYLSRENSKKFYSDGTEFQIGKIEMVSNTGTYIDCPFHRYADGDDLSQLKLESLAELDGVYINAIGYQSIGKEFFVHLDLKEKAVLINTGWSKHWRTDAYFENHPFVTEDAARLLAEKGVKLVGIDSHNIDDTRLSSRPVHSWLLKNQILIVEHMTNLEVLKEKKFLFTAVPPKFVGVGTFPVRAFAKII
jgi:kynurenine formamidase